MGGDWGVADLDCKRFGMVGRSLTNSDGSYETTIGRGVRGKSVRASFNPEFPLTNRAWV